MSGDQKVDASRPSPLWLMLLATGVLLGVFPAFAWYGHWQAGLDGVWAAAVAGLICWAGAISALAMSALLRHPSQALTALLLGMMVRMGLPLGSVVLLMARGGRLVEAGVVGMILVYYLISLAVETVLSLRLVGSSSQVTKAS